MAKEWGIQRTSEGVTHGFASRGEAREYARSLLASGADDVRVSTPGGRTGPLGTAKPTWDDEGNQTGLVITGSTWDED